MDLPTQNIFSCLSHDIIAHEVTHAIVDRLRRFFKWPTNPDMLAFHEGYADIIAIFQHFSFPDILNHAIQETRADLRQPTPLLELAAQFGYATGKGHALRAALDQPNPQAITRVLEPHQRGSILVGAVFDAFFTTFQSRCQDLLLMYAGPKEGSPADEPALRREACAKAIERGSPSSRIVRLAGATHYLFISSEADVLKEVRDFIGGLKE